jgi:ribosomal protein S18 acetylase RimI-like enzyme
MWERANMEIRLVTTNDIEQLCELLNEFYRYSANLQPEYYQAGKESGSYPQEIIKSEDADMFIAVDNGKIVGMIHVKESQTPPYVSIVSHRYAEVMGLIVTASHRRKGIGSLLMNAVRDWGKARNLDYIELFVLSNAKGEKLFYENEEFETTSYNMRCKL